MKKLKLLLHGFPGDEEAEIAALAEVKIVRTTNECLTALRDSEIDAVLVNLGVLRSSARHLLTALRDPAKTTKAGLPVVAILAKNDPKTLQDMVQAGIDQFLIRPFTPGGLLREIDAILDQSTTPSAQTDTYVGPDRRRLGMAATAANNKRRGADS
jgi:two-component system chemotaxis response regulator CheY